MGLIWNQVFAGSNPAALKIYAGGAQWIKRASVFETEGSEFESQHLHQQNARVAQLERLLS